MGSELPNCEVPLWFYYVHGGGSLKSANLAGGASKSKIHKRQEVDQRALRELDVLAPDLLDVVGKLIRCADVF
jgi:hypothetical protein